MTPARLLVGPLAYPPACPPARAVLAQWALQARSLVSLCLSMCLCFAPTLPFPPYHTVAAGPQRAESGVRCPVSPT